MRHARIDPLPSLNAPRPKLLRFMPALNLSRKETDNMLAILENILRKLMQTSGCVFGHPPAGRRTRIYNQSH